MASLTSVLQTFLCFPIVISSLLVPRITRVRFWKSSLEHYQVKRNLAAAGQQLHSAYTTGNERLSCVFCVFARRGDLINGARQHPELYREHVELERETGYTLHMSQRSLPEITGIK
ncbi:hypothetical protein [Deinococcus gobiensis]|uniref:hypothetical protein n=1 Tax=Deinococcus gobiensis TaxID=502394 RepID=UPI0005C14D0F|nr:hypothetical protein [Deinococcus gobiensis]